MKITDNAFNDIVRPFSQDPKNSFLGNGFMRPAELSDSQILRRIKQFRVGEGKTGVKIEAGQFWVGGNTFEEARFRIDKDGNTTYQDQEGYDRVFIGTKE